MMGTIVNAFGVILGGAIGLLFKGGLPQRMRDIMMQALGLCTMFIGISGALSGMFIIVDGKLQTQGTLLLIFSLGIGAVVGEAFRLEDRMEHLAVSMQRLLRSEDNRFVEGMVSNALVICVGAMAVVGALQDGLHHDPSLLYTKALLDAVISMVFASALGIGVLFAVVPLLAYQGGITLLASLVSPLFSTALITSLSYVGNVLIFGVGINLFFGKKIKIGNLLPAIIVPIVYEWITMLL